MDTVRDHPSEFDDAVHDAASHAMAWVGSVFGTRVVPVGVDGFGQSGSIAELYELFDLLPEQIATAGLVAVATGAAS